MTTTTTTDHAEHECDANTLLVLPDPPAAGATCEHCALHGTHSPAKAIVWEHHWAGSTYTGPVAFCSDCMDATEQMPFCRECADEITGARA